MDSGLLSHLCNSSCCLCCVHHQTSLLLQLQLQHPCMLLLWLSTTQPYTLNLLYPCLLQDCTARQHQGHQTSCPTLGLFQTNYQVQGENDPSAEASVCQCPSSPLLHPWHSSGACGWGQFPGLGQGSVGCLPFSLHICVTSLHTCQASLLTTTAPVPGQLLVPFVQVHLTF
jgi:hypothetical protein